MTQSNYIHPATLLDTAKRIYGHLLAVDHTGDGINVRPTDADVVVDPEGDYVKTKDGYYYFASRTPESQRDGQTRYRVVNDSNKRLARYAVECAVHLLDEVDAYTAKHNKS